MKHNFNYAFKATVGHEGGFQSDPNDRGNWTSGRIGVGVNKGTKYGISAMAYPNEDIRNLTLDRSKELYKKDYWDRCFCDDLPSGVDYLVFDIAVNHGVRDGMVFLQKAAGTAADGVWGPNTRAAVNRRDPEDLIVDICMIRAIDYASMQHLQRYWRGWYRRLVRTALEAQGLLDGSNGAEVAANEDEAPRGFLGFRRL